MLFQYKCIKSTLCKIVTCCNPGVNKIVNYPLFIVNYPLFIVNYLNTCYQILVNMENNN